MAVPIELQTDTITQEDARSIRALKAGDATPGMQQHALAFILKKLSRADDLPYVPGGDTHASTFLSGRAFVGKKLQMVLHVPVINFAEK